jgi:hypothetical protein
MYEMIMRVSSDKLHSEHEVLKHRGRISSKPTLHFKLNFIATIASCESLSRCALQVL